MVWSKSDRLQGVQADPGYLNMRPEQYDRSQCFLVADKCPDEFDLIYYSKEEGLIDQSGYDWLITGDPR